MVFSRNFGKHTLEIGLRNFQVAGVLAWVLLLLVIPITIDRLNSSEQINSPTSSQAQTTVQPTSANVETQDDNPLFYTLNLAGNPGLLSTLTLVFGVLLGIIAAGSVVYLVRGRK